MPPKRGDDDHRIDLIPGSSPPNKPSYRVSQAQQEEIMARVNELVQKGMVCFVPTTEQARWDVKDAQVHALIVLSVKCTITPHIRSTNFAKQAWDILAGLYAGRNEAKIALLRKELESKIMNEEDDMDTFLAGVKDINEQLIFAGEVISDSSLMQTILDALLDSYQTFASTWET
ncbi:hypothetical protein L7F22_016650 [Adiantum nelumboides]|nr:hypothetical protein [Adiantum nelumboides]